MTRKPQPTPEDGAVSAEPSAYIKRIAKSIIGDTMSFRRVDYGSGGFVCVIGSYNEEQQRLATWGTGKTWAQALRTVRRTAVANKMGNPSGGVEEEHES